MQIEELPAELVGRFRSLALERVNRLESCWSALVIDSAGAEVDDELGRELHTLKGEARMVGFADVNMLCHRLEDVVAFARRRSYRVPEDMDLVVTMGFRFVAMLVRKKVGANLGGIDLPGFIDQLDSVLAASNEDRTEAPSPAPPIRAERMLPLGRMQLAAAATDVYLEHLNASGASRRRLREVWQTLSNQVAELAVVPLGPRLRRHAQAARELARDLGKPVEIHTEMGELDLRADAAQALDVVVLHLLRNAVDHGIESREQRRRAGKRASGGVFVRAHVHGDELRIEVEDDGGGVDFSAVRGRGVELGLLSQEEAADALPGRLIELLFTPGFSTAAKVSDLSGRGVGLDAARSAVERAGGSVSLRSLAGRGVVALVRIQRASGRVPVHYFCAAGRELAIPASWSCGAATGDADDDALDPLTALALEPDGDRPLTLRIITPEGVALRLQSSSAARFGLAERLCPTDELHPVEVVRIGKTEALLLRPRLLGC